MGGTISFRCKNIGSLFGLSRTQSDLCGLLLARQSLLEAKTDGYFILPKLLLVNYEACRWLLSGSKGLKSFDLKASGR